MSLAHEAMSRWQARNFSTRKPSSTAANAANAPKLKFRSRPGAWQPGKRPVHRDVLEGEADPGREMADQAI